MPQTLDQHAFNIERWHEVSSDPLLSSLDHRVETDCYGHLVMTPPPGLDHGGFQSEIVFLMRTLLPKGKVFTECPVSTNEGVKGLDVAWITSGRLQNARRHNLQVSAPEVCVEILSPSNSRAEIQNKRALYFQSGAEEVWICDLNGKISFFVGDSSGKQSQSTICPDFPAQIEG